MEFISPDTLICRAANYTLKQFAYLDLSFQVKLPYFVFLHFGNNILHFPLSVPEASTLTLCMLGNFSCFCCHLLTFFRVNFLKKNLTVTLSECQTVWINSDTLCKQFGSKSGRKGYQQIAKVVTWLTRKE